MTDYRLTQTSACDCPRCLSVIRLRPADQDFVRCRYCGHEFEPSAEGHIDWLVE